MIVYCALPSARKDEEFQSFVAQYFGKLRQGVWPKEKILIGSPFLQVK